MAEELEEQNPQPFDVGRYVNVIRRRHMTFLILLLLGWGAVWGASWLLNSRYRSSTLILVEPPSMPKNYVVPNVSDDLQDQIQSITEQIMSRTRLLSIIDKLGLYNDEHLSLTPDQKVVRMRKDIDVELVRDSGNRSITAFRILYMADNPHLAQQVTSDLTKLFINENLRTRRVQSRETTSFLQRQLANARADLAQQDVKVRGFESAHAGSLPAQEASNLQILSGLQSQLQNEQGALNTARQQRVYHQSIIDQYRNSAMGRTAQGTGGTPTELTTVDKRLDTLRSRLADLRTRYTDRYPQVQEVKSEIARTVKTRQTLIASLNQSDNTRNQSQDTQISPETDSISGAALLQLQGQLKADEMEIANREQAITSLRSRIREYQARLNDQPAVAQRLADLTRGYEQSQQNYNDLLKKVSDSQMATNMEEMQQGQRFAMIDPPSLPLKPDYPNRMKMCGIGFVAGMFLGMFGVGLLEFFDDRLHIDKDFEKLLPVAVMAKIPAILSPADEKRNRRRAFLGWAMAVMVTVIILAGAAFSYLSA